MRLVPRWIGAAILGLLAGCALSPDPTPPRPDSPSPTPSATSPGPSLPPGSGPALDRPGARWIPVDWSELPGWEADRAAELWPALRAGCQKPLPPWTTLCERAARFTPADDGFARQFLQQELRPYRLEARDGNSTGLATGYFEIGRAHV
jgi:membrane-bound lytic murein transglycosylase A